MRPRIFGTLVASLALVLSSGCAKEQTVADAQAAKLQDQVTSVQRAQDRQFEAFAKDNPDNVAVGAPGLGAPAAMGAPNPGKPAVRIGEAPEVEGDGDIDDPGPRPVIRATGAPDPASSGRRGFKLSEAQARVGDDTDAPRPSALDPEARKAYDAALSLAQTKRCSEALEAFAGFLVRWPDHPYAPNAMYWRGECYFSQGDNPAALREFEGVVSRFALSAKAPDALLKAGIVLDKMGEREKSQAAYARLVKEYPRSEATKRVPGGASAATKASGPKP